ncbi:hypothetical protein B0J17DRAFT_416511 [Rhizoctonia solani]|nr:hypothetical protein B0J17DRAFT_416511 [Rhizoctonia solani]
MPANINSYETDFVARVATLDADMHISKSHAMPINPILAAQQIASTAGALARMGGDSIVSPLRHEVIRSAPTLKRNYGSLDLSRMMSASYSSPSSSVVSTPIDGVFPMHHTKFTQDEGDFIEQDVSPASSAPNSPALEFSTSGRSSWELESFGVTFGSNLTPEFVSADEVSGYLDFMDALEDCDSLGRFAEEVVSDIDSDTRESINRRSFFIRKSGLDTTWGHWHSEHTMEPISTNPNDLSSSSNIELDCADSEMMELVWTSPNPLFDVASPRIPEGSWGPQSPILDSALWAEVASPAIAPGYFDAFQWTRSIVLLVLFVKVILGLVY